MTIPLFSINNISLSAGQRTLISSCSALIHQGESIVITGASGCGKSTLLLALLGLSPLSTGHISYKGEDLSVSVVQKLRKEIAPVFQAIPFEQHTTKEVLYAPFLYHINKHIAPSQAAIAALFEQLFLPLSLLDTPFSHLSGGEAQRVLLCRALLLKRPLYILDEPTSALDPQSSAAVQELFLQQGATVLSISHSSQWIEACDRVFHIENGALNVH